jgi:hypothetical protein
VAEAGFDELTRLMPAAMDAAVRDIDDRIRREQYMDFMGRAYRQTLLCPAEEKPADRPQAAAVDRLAVSSSARLRQPDGAGALTFELSDGSVHFPMVQDVPLVREALERVSQSWPTATRVEQLVPDGGAETDRTVLCQALLRLCARELVELHTYPPPCGGVSSHPQASPLARHQAREGNEVTNLRHGRTFLEGEFLRRLIILLDGSRDRNALAAELGSSPGTAGEPSPRELGAKLNRGLETLAQQALLHA